MDPAQYAELFLTESREHLSVINHALLEIERTVGAAGSAGAALSQTSAPPPDIIASLFRAVHTIKGMSATLGYAAVAGLSHEMEALFDRFRRGELAPDAKLMDTLFAGADVLEASIERAVAGAPPDPRLEGVIARIADASRSASGPGLPKAPPVTPASPRRRPRGKSRSAAGRSRTRSGARDTRASPVATSAKAPATGPAQERIVRVHLAASPLRGARAAVVVQRARTLGEVCGVTPSPELFGQDGPGPEAIEIRLRTGAPPAVLAQVLATAGDVTGVDVLPKAAAGDGRPARRSVAITIPSDVDGNAPAPAGSRARHVRIDLRRLDALMNLIGELVIARGRLLELTASQGESALTDAIGDASRLIGDLHEEIMSCRMVPVWQVFDRFPRLVRDTAHALGKQVAFEVEGKDIQLDKSMLDEIGEPIVHLLRNALDHGIEPPDARLAGGKPAQGHLKLSASRDRSAVLIRVTDDGRGIDRARVLTRALESGLVAAGTTALTDEEVIRLISRPGFTTADHVTDLSGRGVGIDAVQARVRALGGSVEIKSTPGQGTTVTARMPLTLAIMRALIAGVGGESYAFPMAHIDETVGSAGASYGTVRGRPVLLLRGEALPLVWFRDLVGLPPAPRAADEGLPPDHHLIVVGSGGRRAAIAVDELSGQADIVVKQYDSVRGGAALFSGATILGDGAPALIVDVSSLV